MITTNDALLALCEEARNAPAIALDTEFVRTRTYYPQLGLLQLFDGQRVALIDPLGITDWSPMRALLQNRSSIRRSWRHFVAVPDRGALPPWSKSLPA